MNKGFTLLLAAVCAAMVLSACGGEEKTPPTVPPPPSHGGQSEGSAGGGAATVDGLIDLGAALFSGRTADLQCQMTEAGLLLWDDRGAVLYDCAQKTVLGRSAEAIRPLGGGLFYAVERRGEGDYLVTLYDRHFKALAQHQSDRPAIPASDGRLLLYDQREIAVLNTETGEAAEFRVQDVAPDYPGGIWTHVFDGEWVFFAATCNPNPVGTPGIGAYNVLTGQALFDSDYSGRFTGVPRCLGGGKALFWQDGRAYGTDGTYAVLLDAAAGTFTKLDVGTEALGMSPNARRLAALSTGEDAEAQRILLTGIAVYEADTLEQRFAFVPEQPPEPDDPPYFNSLSISDDGRFVAFSGALREGEQRRQTVFLYEVPAAP